jgi:hypothetical protein
VIENQCRHHTVFEELEVSVVDLMVANAVLLATLFVIYKAGREPKPYW